MTELGATDDPRTLIPGDPAAIRDNVTAVRGRGDTMIRVGDGLRPIDTGDAWTGHAADASRDVFTQQPGRWLTAGDAFTVAADALCRYADTSSWAQSQTTDAIHVWNEAQARSAAARTIRTATADAPTQPSPWANIANWRHELDKGVREADQDLIDLARRVDPTRLLTDPAGVAHDVASAATGLAATQPTDIGAAISRGIADDLHTWTTNPARALGHDLPDIALDDVIESAAATQTRESVDRKLNAYLLDPDRPSGGAKARWFEQALQGVGVVVFQQVSSSSSGRS